MYDVDVVDIQNKFVRYLIRYLVSIHSSYSLFLQNTTVKSSVFYLTNRLVV